ncbi:MAG: chromosome segregation protein SMC [Rubrivivax sp.]|jgi:chromosome segregation protein|nr:chromosome segregation protein SMC [Rubrivivax sp.]
MRLDQIKLSGFKSFAEPTTFQLPGRRVGVVGPNGCGKSNIMDAVRWVLGESKASELRGESMQDVIFNGSGQRKPAGRASVELVFDNSAARAGGPWNQFAEIAVKRVLTRDGTSSYYINNQPVRRRDVQDVFLGTGLGPRAYAIIGQGTISRIIESRPEELRLFLEEAAGVSKYKERRRETERRLEDTRENLTRVEDILRELNAGVEKLERQAEVAQRYRALQETGALRQHQLWLLKVREAGADESRARSAVEAATNALEARVAELREVEAELERVRQAHWAAGDRLHVRQGELGEAALEVSRLEERIRHVVDTRARAQARLEELQAQSAQWAAREAAAHDERAELDARIADAEEQADVLHAQAEDEALALPALDDALRAAQGRSAAQRQAVALVQQQIQVLAAEGRGIDDQSRQLRLRRDRLAGERQGLQAPDASRLEALRAASADADEARDAADARLHELHERIETLDTARRDAQQTASREAARAAETTARLDALRALQEKVRTGGRLEPWLARHGLQGLPALWTQLHIEPGWETALESALRERLNALAVGRLDGVRAFAADAPPAKLAFFSPPASATPPTHRTLPRLADLLRLPDDAAGTGLRALLGDWLEGVYTAPDLDAALAERGRLTHGEVVMTPEGHAVSQFAVSFHAPDSEQAGMLARAQEIENLERQRRAQALIADETRAAAVRAEAAYTEASQRLAVARREAADAQALAHQRQVDWLRLAQQAEAAGQRLGRLVEELAELDAQLEALDERRAEGEARFEELDLRLAEAQERHAGLDDEVASAERRLADARERQRSVERHAQEARFQARTFAARRDELARAIETAAAQIAANLVAAEQLGIELESLDDAAARAGLQTALALRVERERALAATRSEYDEASASLRRLEERRLEVERSLEPMRARITALQLELQAAQLGGAQVLEQLQAAAVDLDALARSLDEAGRPAPSPRALQAEIDRIQADIDALGAVNLAALDELAASRERKTFLDAQNADLKDAIRTLEDAIRRIDLETRELLATTFAQVNDHFGRMFPQLFGGGQARLVMTGDEILDAGVQVMAQPPGKRNSTIHLLSGGEKALTAIALVFAIFQLNPAPFCLLDEVDAPLDDANTERYCRLVTEMSAGTQFLFISHNKIAMEMAEQLIGVTMQEQGVSRIVAVDMEGAVGLAQAA